MLDTFNSGWIIILSFWMHENRLWIFDIELHHDRLTKFKFAKVVICGHEVMRSLEGLKLKIQMRKVLTEHCHNHILFLSYKLINFFLLNYVLYVHLLIFLLSFFNIFKSKWGVQQVRNFLYLLVYLSVRMCVYLCPTCWLTEKL